MITIIITTWNEVATLEKSLMNILDELEGQRATPYEVFVVAPDQRTKDFVTQLDREHVFFLEDQHLGKPAAINLAMQKAIGDIVVFTDGDVIVREHAIMQLITHFKDAEVGAVTAQPRSAESKKTKYGFWSHFLVDAAHQKRSEEAVIDVSGYLFAIRKNLVPILPEEILADDLYISEYVRAVGKSIFYEPHAKVYVHYPKNFRDWFKQKRRSAGGYKQVIRREALILPPSEGGLRRVSAGPERSNIKNQTSGKHQTQKIKKDQKIRSKDTELNSIAGSSLGKGGSGGIKTRSFLTEARDGFKLFFSYPKTWSERSWLTQLYLARIMLWATIMVDKFFGNNSAAKRWGRVESSKG
jgi:glycosyltransferase involved in cell wall biosynthesis